jgi:hypothetical protein
MWKRFQILEPSVDNASVTKIFVPPLKILRFQYTYNLQVVLLIRIQLHSTMIYQLREEVEGGQCTLYKTIFFQDLQISIFHRLLSAVSETKMIVGHSRNDRQEAKLTAWPLGINS